MNVVGVLQVVSTDRSVSDARSHVGSSHDSTKSKCCTLIYVSLYFVVSIWISSGKVVVIQLCSTGFVVLIFLLIFPGFLRWSSSFRYMVCLFIVFFSKSLWPSAVYSKWNCKSSHSISFHFCRIFLMLSFRFVFLSSSPLCLLWCIK